MLERHVIFGTAGHVDHGKSALVLALTGTDPDRLAEEKAREMTIDLGFAFLSLPGVDGDVAIVDVPGHEMFVRNMVAGATGIDAAIFVVAADEGVMPQSVEHLDVLRFLNVSTGVIALTKIDRAGPERTDKAADGVRDLVRGTFLEGVPVMRVSPITGEGMPALSEELARIASRVQTKSNEGIFRLPIDRVFTLKGIGTVITGTVISGSLKKGETVSCLPQGRELRARDLHVHNESVSVVTAGQRAAVNLADVSKEDLRRGDMLATPGSVEPSFMVDVRLHLSAAAPRPLTQRTRVRIHHATKEVMARVVLLEGDSLSPGGSTVVQLRLESPLVPASGDLFVMRSYSPMFVIGGGNIVDSHPPKRKKSGGASEIEEREALSSNEIIIRELDGKGARGMEFDRLRVACGLSESALRSALSEAEQQGAVYPGRRGVWFSAGAVEEMGSEITARVAELHGKNPLRTFVPLNAVASGAAPSADQRECFRITLDSLVASSIVAADGKRLRLSSHSPQWTGRHGEARGKILEKCRQSGLSAPSPVDLAGIAELDGKECQRILDALADAGELIMLDKGIYLHPEVFAASRAKVEKYLERHGKITIGQCRDLLNSSRKYLLPFMERLDSDGLTVRRGDHRVLLRD